MKVLVQLHWKMDMILKIETALDYAVFVVLVVAIASIVPVGTCIAVWMLFKAAKN